MHQRVALIAGVTGLVGRELVKALLLHLKPEWEAIYGVARHQESEAPAYQFVHCDLLDREDTLRKLSPLAGKVTHLFWITWASQSPLDTTECCHLNRAMLSNTLDALLQSSSSLSHVALQTGTNHYVSLRVAGSECDYYYYDENSPRVVVDGGEEAHNFYYALEDLVRERLGRSRIGWSVHRPGLLLGASTRSHFNFVGSLCVYGSICRHLGMPFKFYGERRCWEEPYMDASDARLVVDQLIWWAKASSSSSQSQGQAFNAINGTVFTWREIWPALTSTFRGDTTMSGFSEELTYAEAMGDKGGVWEDVVKKYGLRATRMEELANWVFLDTVFRFPVNMLVNGEKACRMGFTTVHGVDTAASILYWVDRMREENLVPCFD